MRVRPRERENFDEIVSTIKRAKKSKTKNDNRADYDLLIMMAMMLSSG